MMDLLTAKIRKHTYVVNNYQVVTSRSKEINFDLSRVQAEFDRNLLAFQRIVDDFTNRQIVPLLRSRDELK